MKHKLLSILLSLSLVISLLPTVALADEGTSYTHEDIVVDSDGTYHVSNEEQLRRALYYAPTNGTQRTIMLTDDISLEMTYTALLFAHSNTADKWQHGGGKTAEEAAELAAKPENNEIPDNNTEYDTLSHYKIAVNGWDTVSTDLAEQAKFGANYPMNAVNPVARLVVKAGQNVIIDLNGKTIAKRPDATHGNWGETDTDIIGNYGTLTITDTSTGEKGTIRGRGYNSCGGAVLHNYAGATMTVEAVNVDGNAMGMSAGTGQYVISNEGGMITIDGANVYDNTTENVDASLINNVSGTMTVKGNATLNHPNTKTINAKGGEVIIESATIISDNYAIYAKGGTTNITGDVTIKASANDKPAGKLAVAGGTITKAENIMLPEPEGKQWVKNGDVEVLVNATSVAVINSTGYDTLAAAVAAANDGDIITLAKDCSGDGIVFPTDKFNSSGLTIEFNNCTYTISGTLVGSNKSETLGFQLLKGNKITLKNGTITNDLNCVAGSSTPTWTENYPSIILQNYCDLTLDNMTVTPVGGTLYTMSNNCGDVVIKDTIINTVPNGVAFDVYGGFGNYSDVTVTVTGSSEINGKIEVARGSGTQNKNTLAINGGTINGELAVTDNEKTEITISGGSFSQPVKEEYCADGFIPKDNGNGTYGVKTGTYAAKIGDTKYESLEAAVANVAADETITLLQNVPAESVITVARTISFKVDTNKADGSGVYAFAADTNIIKGNNTTLTKTDENDVYTYSFVYTAPSSGSGSSGYYVSTPSKTENGTVTVSPRYADKGSTVTVTVKPDSGYVLGSLTVTDSKGNELTLTDKGDGKYTFTMPSGRVEVKASFVKEIETSPFADVATDAYYYEAVKWAVGKGITTGVGDNLFAPEQPCTRAQIVTFLWRAAGSPEPKGTAAGMTDVVSGSYYEKAVAWAIENGVTTGTTATTFSPDATCTRAQAVTFLARALNAKAASAAEFSDVPADSYFANAVAWASANGVTEGVGNGLFAPDNNCTRGQIVTFLFRAYNK